ncbi:M23 family metallopeptidase [Cytobacillus massiliigabonensis]|uniref:M23 family metallopeptidase n=1 Tax=Cytobacillus massiliigabonensis TaxID=1871011 RepID=UPI000C817F28|nr:M23 family metallopeptidase [Cytobacillus massiliigabonensis]
MNNSIAGDFTCQPFRRPAEGYISSGYGPRNGGFHFGIDIANHGTSVPVYAAFAGVVSRSQSMGGYGEAITIKHREDTVETLYAHLSRRLVSPGEVVSPGQLIGYTGTTGDSTGIHLHFEVHEPSWNSSRSNAKNPLPLISDETTSPICWDGLMMNKGQIGRITILKPINLWRRDATNKLELERILNQGEVYRVYSYDELYGGQYGLGGRLYVTKMDGYIKYETPGQKRLDELKRIYP